jgi:hypothetical protein
MAGKMRTDGVSANTAQTNPISERNPDPDSAVLTAGRKNAVRKIKKPASLK